jgi:hypothetical protein
LVLILAVIPLGRRVLIYTLILTAFSIGPKLFKMFKDKKLKMLHLICIAFLFLIISVWGFQIFYATRIALNKLSLERKPPLTEIIPYTIDLMKDSYARAEMQERQRENILHRPFILSYFAGILKVHSGKEISPFLEFRHALAMSIPSLINPDKTRELKPAGEDIIHPLIGIPVFDGPNTIVTAGLNDLGLIGVFIYPIAIVGLYLIIIRSLPAKCPPFVYAFIVLRLIYSILYIEEGLGSLVGSGLRDLFLVAGFYWIISSLPMMRSSIRKAL